MNPIVSIVVPCYNEAGTIGRLLEATASQTYPQERLEIVIADGGSEDGTRKVIERFSADHPGLRLTLINNPKRVIPAALNRAIEVAEGEIVIRLDAH